jgi:hypothetical protein
LRAAFWCNGFREKTVQDTIQALTAKGTQPLTRNAAMLGVVAGVCSRHAQAKETLAALKPHYYAFFVRELVGSRTAVPKHLITGLRDFISTFVTLDDLEKDVIPHIEKGLLRAPEVVLDILANLLSLLPTNDYDLSKILDTRLLKPLLSNVKSSNPVIREGVLSAFKEAATRSSVTEIVSHIIDEILSPLKSGKLASADQRVLHAHMLRVPSFSSSDATKIAVGLAAVAVKEGNEAALSAELSVLTRAAICLLQDGAEVPKPVLEAFVKGLSDKNISVRRLWVLQSGEVLLSQGASPRSLSEPATKFAEAIMMPMTDNWAETIKNPAAAAQSGLITSAYVLAVLGAQVLSHTESTALQTKLKKIDVMRECFSVEPKSAFFLNHRVYSRLSAEDDCRWFLRSLQAVSANISDTTESIQAAWSQAFIYLVSSTTIPYGIRKASCEAIATLYTHNPSLMSAAMIGGLWQWVEASDKKEKDSIASSAKFEKSHLHLVLRSISLNYDDLKKLEPQQSRDFLERQMCALLVLARRDLIPRCSWIDLCLNVGVDPGALARKYEQELIDQLIERTESGQNVRYLTLVSCTVVLTHTTGKNRQGGSFQCGR